MKLVTFTTLAVLLSIGYAFAGAGAPVPPTGEWANVYIAADRETGKCSLTTNYPNSLKYKVLGEYKTLDAAQKAMAENQECSR
jgi:hypothetical protein